MRGSVCKRLLRRNPQSWANLPAENGMGDSSMLRSITKLLEVRNKFEIRSANPRVG
jgi:hypothetical protein